MTFSAIFFPVSRSDLYTDVLCYRPAEVQLLPGRGWAWASKQTDGPAGRGARVEDCAVGPASEQNVGLVAPMLPYGLDGGVRLRHGPRR